MSDLLRGFISYSTADKSAAAAVKGHLLGLGVDCFVAHDDLVVSDEWRQRIVEELQRMEVFIALLSADFKASEWAPQELGFAVARPEIPIIPLTLDGTVPFGFIGKLQAKRFDTPPNDANFLAPLHRHYPRRLIPALIARMRRAGTFRDGEALMEPLLPYFRDFAPLEIDAFVEACIANGQLWNAAKCSTKYIPAFVDAHKHRIRAARLEVLLHQVRKGEAHPAAREA